MAQMLNVEPLSYVYQDRLQILPVSPSNEEVIFLLPASNRAQRRSSESQRSNKIGMIGRKEIGREFELIEYFRYTICNTPHYCVEIRMNIRAKRTGIWHALHQKNLYGSLNNTNTHS